MAKTHECPGGCGQQVQRAMFSCRSCWSRLPWRLRQAITSSYRRDVAAHARAMADACEWFGLHNATLFSE